MKLYNTEYLLVCVMLVLYSVYFTCYTDLGLAAVAGSIVVVVARSQQTKTHRGTSAESYLSYRAERQQHRDLSCLQGGYNLLVMFIIILMNGLPTIQYVMS